MSLKLPSVVFLRLWLLSGVLLFTACQSGTPTALPGLLPTRTALAPGVRVNPTAGPTDTPPPIATPRALSANAITQQNVKQLRIIATQDEAAPSRILALSDKRILGQAVRSFELIDGTTLTLTARTPFELRDSTGVQLYWYTASSDTSRAATLDIDGSLKVYDLDKRLVSNELKLDTPVGTSKSDIALSRDGKQLVYANGSIQRYDIKTGKTQGRAQNLPDATEKILFSEDGARLAAVQPDGNVVIFDTRATQRAATPLTLQTGFTEVRTLLFSPSGTHVGISDGQTRLAIWNLTNSKLDTPLRTFIMTEPVLPVFNETAAQIALVSNASVRILKIDSGEEVQSLKLKSGISPTGAYFDRSGKTIYVTSANTLTQFQVADGKVIHSSTRAAVTHVATSPDGTRVVSWGTWNPSTEVAIWDAKNAQPIAQLPHTAAVRWVVLGPSQKNLASITVDNTLHVWNVNDGGQSLSLPAPTSEAQRALLCLTADDNSVVFIEQGQVVVQPVERGQPSSFALPAGSRGYTTCQNRQQWVAFATSDAILVLDLAGKTHSTIAIPTDAADLRGNILIILSDDGEHLAAVSQSALYIWTTSNATLVSKVPIQRPALFGIVFSPDGTRVALNYGDGADIVSVADGKVTSLDIPTEPQARWVNLIFGADSKMVITASRISSSETATKDIGAREYVDGEIAFWDTATGKLIHSIDKAGLIYSVAASADGARLVTGTQSEQLTIWAIAK